MSRHYLTASLLCVALVTLRTPIAAGVTFNDGTVHIIDASNSYVHDRAEIRNSGTGIATTVEIHSDGIIGDSVNLFGTSVLKLMGGTLGTFVQAGDSAHIDIFSGNVGGGG
jgi:hypothetical protein